MCQHFGKPQDMGSWGQQCLISAGWCSVGAARGCLSCPLHVGYLGWGFKHISCFLAPGFIIFSEVEQFYQEQHSHIPWFCVWGLCEQWTESIQAEGAMKTSPHTHQQSAPTTVWPGTSCHWTPSNCRAVWGLVEVLQLLWWFLVEQRRANQIKVLPKRKMGRTWPLDGEFGSSQSAKEQGVGLFYRT